MTTNIEELQGTLELDAQSIAPEELSMGTLMRELNLQKKPAWLLVKLMNALEQKRQKKGLGWSRAWNKYGLNVFRTHLQDVENDREYFDAFAPLLNSLRERCPAQYRSFIDELLSDPTRMCFTFYHNNDSEAGQFEGLTLSLGRRVPDDKTKRDRLDIILEDRRVDGRVDGKVDRLRVYVCPWESYGPERGFHLIEETEFEESQNAQLQELYAYCVRKYHDWKTDEARQWSHWSVRFIDYFGPRKFIPVGTSFS